MKKVLPVIVIAALVGGWWFLQGKPEVAQDSSAPTTPAAQDSSDVASGESSSRSSTDNLPTQRPGVAPRGVSDDGEETSELVDQVKPAADVYHSADEALAAVEAIGLASQ